MRSVTAFLRARTAWVLGLVALAMAQAGCAHPVWVEPSVVVHTRIGGPVHFPVHGAPPVVVAPPTVWVHPAPIVLPPRVVLPAPIHHPGWHGGWRGHPHQWRGHGRGHQHWPGHRGGDGPGHGGGHRHWR